MHNSQVKFANKGGPNKGRQEASHPHSANFVNPSWSRDQFVHVPDLGNDQTHMLSFDGENRFDGDNRLVNTIEPIEAAPGSGPRHITYDSKQKLFAYGINELDSTITRYIMFQGKL